MRSDVFNELLRNFFQQLLNEGHSTFKICSCTLGSQSSPQLNKFIQGQDLGIKPLDRLMETLGYDLLLCAVPKNDEQSKVVAEINHEFFHTLKLVVSEQLESFEENSKRHRKVRASTEFINNFIQDTINNVNNSEEIIEE